HLPTHDVIPERSKCCSLRLPFGAPPTLKVRQSAEQRDELGLPSRCGLGKDRAEMRSGRRWSDADRDRRFVQTLACSNPLRQQRFCRRQLIDAPKRFLARHRKLVKVPKGSNLIS